MTKVTVFLYDGTVRWEAAYHFRNSADAYDFVHLCNKRNLECELKEVREVVWETEAAWKNLLAFANKVIQ